MLKKSLFFMVLTFFCCLTMALPQPQGTVQTLDRIVAVVNKSIITELQLDQQAKMYKMQLRARGLPVPGVRKLKSDTLNGMIDQQLQMQLAQRNNIKISNLQLNQAIRTIAQQNHMNVSELRQKVETTGQTYKAYRQMLRKQLLIQEIQKQVIASHVVISPQEVAGYVQKHQNGGTLMFHIQDIVLSGASGSKALEVANHMLQQLQQHKISATASALNKAAAGQTVTINDMGWQSRQNLPDLFSKYLNGTAKTGQFVGPIKAPNGIHILKIANRKLSRSVMTKQQAQMMLFQQKFQSNLKAWLEQLRHSAYIEIMH